MPVTAVSTQDHPCNANERDQMAYNKKAFITDVKLKRISDNSLVTPVEVDKELCEHFNVPYSNTQYLENWENYVLDWFALGMDWEEMKEDYHPELNKVIDYLAEHYTICKWW